MAQPFAFVTLISSDAYLPGALVQAAALRDIHNDQPSPPEVPFSTVCLVTPETVDVSTVKRLRKAFDLVVGVEVLEQDNPAGLKLLGRPDLTTVLTKLHVFRLTQFEKIIFLDADVLPIRPLSHLFTLPYEFSAVPDVGWPDIFNSGVLVLTPGEDKFEELSQLMATKPSWDGGDQGLLNEWRGDNWHRLSFTYNTTPTAAYTYAPAYERFGSLIKAIHFIGPNKPWNSIPYRNARPQSSDESVQTAYDYDSLVDRWFDVYDRHYNTPPPRQAEFEVGHYTPAWERPSAEPPAKLDLDDLKRLAIQGLNASQAEALPGEGAYRSLPLQGRVDLMRPRKPQPEEKEGEIENDNHPVINPTTDQWLQPHDAFVPATEDSDRFPAESFNYDELLTTPVARHAGVAETDQSRWRTPGPEEVPSSPRLRLVSLPPTPSPFAPVPSTAPDFYASESESESFLLGRSDIAHEFRSEPTHKPHAHEHHHEHASHQQEQPQPQQQTPKRTISPPMMSWNPAIEPPPNVPPTHNAFPTDTYFPNVWDHTPSRQNDQAYSGPSQPDSAGFFQPPPPPVIPESLIKQGHYRNVTGESPLGANPSPDRSKLKTVFPWEEKPRAPPRRVFPDSDAPPPSLFLSPGSQSQTSTTTPSTPETRASNPPRNLPLSPLYGLPNAFSYSNAWDNVPSIQKYASKLVKPPPPPPTVLAPAFEDDGYKKGRRKSWDERAEVSSRDGDDEDNADDEDDEDKQPAKSRWDDDDSDREARKRRSRRGSVVDPNVLKAKRKEYKSRAVQTTVVEKRSQGVQVESPQAPSRSDSTSRHAKRGSASNRKHWAPTTHSSVAAPTTTHEVSAGGHNLPTAAPIARAPALGPENAKQRKKSPSVSPTYSPIRSPREFVVSPPNVGGPSRPAPAKAVTTPPSKPPSKPTIRTSNNSSTSTLVPMAAPAPGPASAPPLAHPPVGLPSSRPPSTSRVSPSIIARRTSNDSSLGSPASSIGPLSPADSAQGMPAIRKGTRVWDPARGVELFKRGSEEVLARFLKMSNWEEENR
ncbi:hypothetical protein CVT26_011244 [Gymnopilus dilepis]|uniref:glycogenin glucosyltransferase n=1 Tax=Gymnopilus dilepis TaxID=231916 RepID=A0A409VYY8_9AGAR|nr:hypothetical protein CVT26_011244 [Gymnopilus dilepis]